LVPVFALKGFVVRLSKRVLDLVIIGLMLPVLIPAGIAFALLIWRKDGRPVFFVSERMSGPKIGFTLWKFRTMTVEKLDSGVSGGHKAARITTMGRILRRTHADEIPQLWNVIRGDISLVGPRPPLRSVVERFPEVYNQVLQNRPGITGMASYFYARHEDWLLRNCKDAAEAEAVYARACVPRKARLDMIYQKHQSIKLDLWLIWITAAAAFHLPGGRPVKVTGRAKEGKQNG
jgi:lipopolysaccharide/colanic/teichoic acid biosynthesis glycosyltransferase